jgi:hypothetical protein
MNFETWQKAWQSQDTGANVIINADVLLKEVRRNQQHFRAMIFWRDVREVGLALLLTLFFSYQGLRHQDWTDGLIALACFGIGAFMLADRLVQRRKRPAANDTLKTCIESSLLQVRHQIWLLKNVLWWYLLPLGAALVIAISYSTWHVQRSVSDAMISWGIGLLVIMLVYWGIYRLNQFAVRASLEPRRQELETLLTSLNENAGG